MPGETPDVPNIYQFGITYKDNYNVPHVKSKKFHEKIGILGLLERYVKLKEKADYFFDKTCLRELIIKAEEKWFVYIYNSKVSLDADHKSFVVNFDIKDTIQDVSNGAKEITDFVLMCLSNTGANEMKFMKGLEVSNQRYSKNNISAIVEY